MRRLYVICEGQTEERFIRHLLAPQLLETGVAASARLLGPPGQKGGFVSWARVRSDIVAVLRSDPHAVCTTFVDYYGPQSGFPGDAAVRPGWTPDIIARTLAGAMAAELSEREFAGRFLPYVQMHEFEALLFSDPEGLVRAVLGEGTRATKVTQRLRDVCAEFGSPEAINSGRTTAPSKRILEQLPEFKKSRDGIVIATEIGLPKLRRACPLFSAWVERLEALGREESR